MLKPGIKRDTILIDDHKEIHRSCSHLGYTMRGGCCSILVEIFIRV